MRARFIAAVFAGVVAAGLLTGAGSAGATAVKVPNPCTIVPKATVTKDLGYSMTVIPTRKSTTQAGGRTCTFSYPHLKLTVELSLPSGFGGGRVKTSHPTGMGKGALLWQPLSGSTQHFATLYFHRNGIAAFVSINKDQPVKGLEAVGRAIYARL